MILALDQGTTSSRAILFDQGGQMRGLAQKEFAQHFPQPGWVEHDPEEIWQSQLEVARQVLAESGITASQVAAIGITNQRETTLLWDRESGKPIAPAIVWQDRRTADFCQQIREGAHGSKVVEQTGLIPDAYFSASKIRWLLDNVEGARRRAQAGKLAFGTIDSWLVYRLSGGKLHLTDVSNASRTMLFDLNRMQWSDELLELFDIPASVLPEVRGSSERYGVSEASLFGKEVPIAGIAGDQQAALFGQLCQQPGLSKNTYGTGCFMLLNVGEQPVPSANRLLSTVAWKIGEKTEYALEGSVFVAGAVVQWLRDGLGIIKSAPEIEGLASQVDDSDGVYLVPAFAGLGAPQWDPYARGTITGLTRGTTSAHLARAALEGIAFQVADMLEAMQADAGIDLGELRVDGGASANNLLMQIQADLLQVPTVRPKVTETTALGAAYLAGLAVGFWQDRQELISQWQVDRRFEPSRSADWVKEKKQRWRAALECAGGWLNR